MGGVLGIPSLGRVMTDTSVTTPTDATPLLQVEGLKKHFEIRSGLFGRIIGHVHAVENVTFELGRQQTLGLVGESRCGKSTVGKTILKLLEPTAGTIRLDGLDITRLKPSQMRPIRKQVQIIFQDPYSSLNPRMTAGRLVAEPMVIHGFAKGKELEERIAWLFEKVGLRPEAKERYPHEFSGGQRQRLCIARALGLNPKLIVADESVAALDVSIRASVINLLMDLQEEFGVSYLFISHDMAVVEHISHQVAVMYLGNVVELAGRNAILHRAQAPLHRGASVGRAGPRPQGQAQDALDHQGRHSEPGQAAARLSLPHSLPVRDRPLPDRGAGAA